MRNVRIALTIAAAATALVGVVASSQTPRPPAPAVQAPPPGQQQPAQAGDDSGQLVVDVTGGRRAPMPIAIPYMPTPAATGTAAGNTAELGHQVSDIIANNLRNSGLFSPIGPQGLPNVAFAQVTAPDFGAFGATGAQALVQGFVQANGDGTLTVGCYLYDVASHSELARQGFVVQPAQWRRAAHKCSDTIYTRLTGEGPYFDTRVIYVSETGPARHRIKRLAIMDQDGANHRFLTNGQATVLTPRFAPNQQTVAYMSYENNQPRVYVYDVGSGRSRPLVSQPYMTFAPRFSPDGHSIIFSMSVNGNTDIYRVSSSGGTPQRLTNSPGIDDGGSFSPDGRRIVFESDRGGTQQLYVMNADGSNQHRISFGGGRYGTPVWSPRGDLIAFTQVGSFRIGVMNPDGSGERILTGGPLDEGPTWAPNGRVIMFSRANGQIWSVDITGMAMRRVPTPLGASDPSWSPLRD
ncbi:Tol-Pal system beta propeller repeat protein TolB [Sphingosinicella ginsenosidimutans]|uniref:Tol-Pal system protein TolB n=1 Tax=Allosphingosinicella ginsenosidimutans TaxID=1176539 RepID=A0A5C6TYM5_9SPHN|nr:Tol-Pal system protein TolB [Sphingosinicella ginsenosidimutans]